MLIRPAMPVRWGRRVSLGERDRRPCCIRLFRGEGNSSSFQNFFAGSLLDVGPRVSLTPPPGVPPLKRLLTSLAILIPLLATALPARAQDLPAVISQVRVQPSPFSPNRDGLDETTTFSFFLSERSRVTVEILFFAFETTIGGVNLHYGPLTDTLLLGGRRVPFASDTVKLYSDASAGLNEFSWDGRIRHKILQRYITLPDSEYTYLIRAEDLDADDSYRSLPITGRVRVDAHPPVISGVSAEPNPFSPDNDRINDLARIGFTLDGMPANAVLGNLVFTVNVDPDGNRSFVLDNSGTTPALRLLTPLNVPHAPIALQFIKTTQNNNAISLQFQGGRILDSGDTVQVNTGQITIAPDDPLGTVYRDDTRFSYLNRLIYNGGTGTVETSRIELRTSAGWLAVKLLQGNQVIFAETCRSIRPLPGMAATAPPSIRASCPMATTPT